MSLVCGTIFLEVGSQQAVHVGGQGDKDVLDANVPVLRIGGEERVTQRMAADVDPVGHFKPGVTHARAEALEQLVNRRAEHGVVGEAVVLSAVLFVFVEVERSAKAHHVEP